MEIETGEHSGTTVMIELPRCQTSTHAADRRNDDLVLARETKKILCVDDDPTIANGMAIQLQELGYQVVCQTSSRDAHALFACDPNQFALIITDQTMPEMTGAALIKSIQNIRPEIPAIILTGFASDTTECPPSIRCMSKPVSVNELSHTVDELLHDCNATT